MTSIGFYIVLAAAPVMLLLAGSKLAKHTFAVFGVTTVVTWIATTLFLTRLIDGVDDIGAIIIAMLLFTPALGIGVASTIGRVALKAPGLVAVVFACQGWYVGMILLMLAGNLGTLGDGALWDWGCALVTAIPATYAALGAAVAGNLKWRWQT